MRYEGLLMNYMIKKALALIIGFLTFNKLSVASIIDYETYQPNYDFLKSRYHLVNNPYLFDGTPEAVHALSRLPDELLPRLPDGYMWSRTPYSLQLMKYNFSTAQPEEQTNIEVVIYGPDTRGNINYLTSINGVNYQGFINMRPWGDPFQDTQAKNSRTRRYPISQGDFNVLAVKEWETWGSRWDRGHIIPLCATMEVGRVKFNGQRNNTLFVSHHLRHLPNG
jgi:hypothetical protein